jgi:hypothetical protein
MLQTSATGRIYAEGGSEETMGHGSTMTFKVADGVTNFSNAQIKELMKAVRIVFVDEANNIIALGLLQQNTSDARKYEISNGAITSDITLYNFTVTNGQISVGKQIAPNDNGQTELVALTQNKTTGVSVLVYLDGDMVDNTMVPAGSSAALTGSLNLQFSSSADLNPMDYSELQEGNQ